MVKPIIPWMGGKRRLVDKILPLIPKHTCYVEVFAGGAALFYNKEPSKAEVLNDINGDLVNLYRVVQNHFEEFVRQFKWAIVSREMFEWEKLKDPTTLTDIQRAARFFYLQKSCFGGKAESPTYGISRMSPPRFNLLRLEETLSEAHCRLARVNIEHLDWQACVRKYDRPGTLFYLDPPYWKTAGYGVGFGIEQYREMADLMVSMKGKAILSINDHPTMRKVFEGLKIKSVAIKYTVGGAHKGKQAKELIICN